MRICKLILATTFILCLCQFNAQTDTTFHDRNWKLTTRSEAQHYRVKVKNGTSYDVKDYSISGVLDVSGTYASFDPEMKEGNFIFYRENGTVRFEGKYAENKMDGKWTYYDTLGKIKTIDEYSNGNYLTHEMYYGNGILKRRESYRDGQFESGNCYSENGEAVVYFPFEETAEFPGGRVALIKYLRDSLVYPPLARKNRIEGKVYLRFEIDATGKVTNVKVTKGDYKLLNDAAISVVSNMPDWIPGKVDGQPVSSHIDLPIIFTRR